MYQFEAAPPHLFRQRETFNVLITERRLIHRELRNKVQIMREFDTRDIVLVGNQVKSIRKDGESHKL